ncbi:hypothetical protein C8J57DRAFT_1725257 [Mycena rebaudengoi]|nr:hypothetical protein C8J57DRAFT_1725257 [Mycena rebaudengoi]
MAPPSWATEVQRAWLETQMPRYVKSQADGKLTEFWPSLQGQWFRNFPEEATLGLPPLSELGDAPVLTDEQIVLLGAAIKARKSKLENWFRNQASKQRRAAPKQTRARRAIELFQIRNKPKIDEALEEAGYFAIGGPDAVDNWVDESDGTQVAELKSHQALRMRVCTRVVKALFNSQSEEVKTALEEEAEAAKEAAKQARLVEAEEDEEESTPQSYLQSIDELADAYSRIHEATLKKAGWMAVTITGGPNPRFNGELSMKVICSGVTPAGNSFETAHPDFHNGVSLPYQQFLRHLFTADVRRARALDSEEAASSNDEELEPEKPKKSKRKKSKKKQSKPTADDTGDSLSITVDTTPTNESISAGALPAGDSVLGNTLPSGNDPLPTGDSTRPPSRQPSTRRSSSASLAFEEQEQQQHDTDFGFGDSGMDVDPDPFGTGMDVDLREPSWAQQFDPALLRLPLITSPTPPVACRSATSNEHEHQPEMGRYAPSPLFRAFSFSASPSPSAPPASGPQPCFVDSGPVHVYLPDVSAPGHAVYIHFHLLLDNRLLSGLHTTATAAAVANAAASLASKRAAARRTAGPSLLGKQGEISFSRCLPIEIGLRLPAANPPAASLRPTSGLALRAPSTPPALLLSLSPVPLPTVTTTTSAPALPAPAVAPLRPVSNLPAAFASPQKSTGLGRSAKQPPVPPCLAGIDLDTLPTVQPGMGTRRINEIADAAIAKRAVDKRARQERLRNPSGGADLVVVPLPPRERKRKELDDGTMVVMPRKRTRREIEQERVEALMLARREPDKERSPAKSVKGVRAKAAGGSKAAGAAPKKRAAATRGKRT